jgi:hypothetical protein
MSDEVKDETLIEQVVAAAKPALTLPEQLAADEVARLRSENEDLKRAAITAKVEAENTASDLRIKALVAAAHKPMAPLQGGQDAVARSRAIAAVGDLFRWMQTPPDDRCAALGVADSAAVKDSTLKTYFGKSSDSLAVQQLAKSNPAEYRRLKVIAIERGLY